MAMKIERLCLILALITVRSVQGFSSSGSVATTTPRGRRVPTRKTLGSSTRQQQQRTFVPKPLQAKSSASDEARKYYQQQQQRNQKQLQDDANSNPFGRFAVGLELEQLRMDLEKLRENLQATKDINRVADIHKAVCARERRDPDFVYAKARRMVAQVVEMDSSSSQQEKDALIAKWESEAVAARACLPQFQLEGLWVGNFGSHGNELVNITYAGDTLVATKTTGDVNVPRGKVSFTADLAPRHNSKNATLLEPLQLNLDSSKKSLSSAKLPRFLGQGQVAKPGFVQNKLVDGQLILFSNQFSFVWIPNKQHVLFRRPTPQQTVHMLRDTVSKEDELDNMRRHLTTCYNIVDRPTESEGSRLVVDHHQHSTEQHHSCSNPDDDADHHGTVKKQERVEPFRRISQHADLERLEAAQEEEEAVDGAEKFNFWQVHKKWRRYIDGVLLCGKQQF